MRASDGTWRWFQLSAVDLRQDDYVGAIAVVFRDVSIRREVDVARRAEEERFHAVVRHSYDAIALTDNGDLKSEVWGDGKSYATSTSYTMATSYLAILGGWKNSFHVLARLNEHGTDRKEIRVDKDSDDPRQRAVVRGQRYQFKIERTDGKTIRMSVNGAEYFSWTDSTPLAGLGHDHLGFNEWESKVCFDNVKVTPLGG